MSNSYPKTGAPALRIRGLYLAVATLAFAVAARGWFFGLDVFTNGKTTVSVPRAHVGPFDLHSQRAYYYFCLAVLVVLVAVVARLRRSGVGRVLVAVRDNENAASSFTAISASILRSSSTPAFLRPLIKRE